MPTNMNIDRRRTVQLLQSVGKEQIAIAQLEVIGLPLRIINLLEDYLGVIWLEDLLNYTPAELKERVPNLGDKSVRLIVESIGRIDRLIGPKPTPASKLRQGAPWTIASSDVLPDSAPRACTP